MCFHQLHLQLTASSHFTSNSFLTYLDFFIIRDLNIDTLNTYNDDKNQRK